MAATNKGVAAGIAAGGILVMLIATKPSQADFEAAVARDMTGGDKAGVAGQIFGALAASAMSWTYSDRLIFASFDGSMMGKPVISCSGFLTRVSCAKVEEK